MNLFCQCQDLRESVEITAWGQLKAVYNPGSGHKVDEMSPTHASV